MKKTLIKLLSSTIALTLVLASSSVGTAQIDKIKTEDVKADNTVAVVQEVKEENKGTGIIEALEEKMKEEVPVVEVKAEPVAAPEAEAKAEEAAAPEVKVAPAEVAVPEIEVVPAEEVAAPEAEPVETWNISASESDNVAMKFYAEPTAESDQITVDRQNGIVEITGTGAMEENVYRHFMSTEKYLATIEALFEAEYGVEVDLVYDDTITDVLELDANIRIYIAGTEEPLAFTENMYTNINPANFLEYSPRAIIINKGITNVSDYAFVCCADLEEIVLPSTIKTIGESAFEYCVNLRRVVMPEGTKIRIAAFSGCQRLETVQFVGEATNNDGIAAQSEENNAPVRTLTAEEVNALVYGQ